MVKKAYDTTLALLQQHFEGLKQVRVWDAGTREDAESDEPNFRRWPSCCFRRRRSGERTSPLCWAHDPSRTPCSRTSVIFFLQGTRSSRKLANSTSWTSEYVSASEYLSLSLPPSRDDYRSPGAHSAEGARTEECGRAEGQLRFSPHREPTRVRVRAECSRGAYIVCKQDMSMHDIYADVVAHMVTEQRCHGVRL